MDSSVISLCLKNGLLLAERDPAACVARRSAQADTRTLTGTPGSHAGTIKSKYFKYTSY